MFYTMKTALLNSRVGDAELLISLWRSLFDVSVVKKVINLHCSTNSCHFPSSDSDYSNYSLFWLSNSDIGAF